MSDYRVTSLQEAALIIITELNNEKN